MNLVMNIKCPAIFEIRSMFYLLQRVVKFSVFIGHISDQSTAERFFRVETLPKTSV